MAISLGLGRGMGMGEGYSPAGWQRAKTSSVVTLWRMNSMRTVSFTCQKSLD
jgi:hypothetical protein